MSEHLTISQLESATQQTQEWLNDLASRPPFENQEQAYSHLRAVLHAVRDRLTAEEVTHLGSQLPMVVRGFYFEGWRPAEAPNDFETPNEFYEHARRSLGGATAAGQLDLATTTRTVLEFLTDHVDPGEIRHVRTQLPDAIAALFPETTASTG